MTRHTFNDRHAKGHIVKFQARVNGYFRRDGAWTRIRPAYADLMGVDIIHDDGSYGLVAAVNVPRLSALPFLTLGRCPQKSRS
jgi:hypothetical protein